MINKKLGYHLIRYGLDLLPLPSKYDFKKISQGGKMNKLNSILPYRFPTTIDTFA
jgi:hypothetical protein